MHRVTALDTAMGVTVRGGVSLGFEAVREAFAENFLRRHELGGACGAYHHGEKVVDLWGGIRDERTGEPWERDTMVLVYSATKGLAAMTLAIAHSRGWLDYEERVACYWPEFGQNGKARITVRQLLTHQAGLFALDEPLDRSLVADLDRLAVVLARQRPAWEPGPEEIPDSRLATLAPPRALDRLLGFPLRFTLETLNPRSKIVHALRGSSLPHDERRVYARNLEVPSGGAVGTARAIARAYGVFASGGRELGLRQETLNLLAAPAVPPTRGFYDECLKGEVQFSLGFMKPSPLWPLSPSSFGSPGAGGALGFADSETGVGYAYVTNQMGTTLSGDPREVALREALYSALGSREGITAARDRTRQ